jgi:uncharacterized protein YodC (DUF2158 family)
MANAFSIGQIVRLKSGGPAMTVTRIPASHLDELVHTTWFAGKKAEHGGFPPNALKIVPDGEEDEDD